MCDCVRGNNNYYTASFLIYLVVGTVELHFFEGGREGNEATLLAPEGLPYGRDLFLWCFIDKMQFWMIMASLYSVFSWRGGGLKTEGLLY